MDFQVELMDYFDRIEGEEITAYYACVIDENNHKWKYAYHRQPRQSIPEFVDEVQDAFRYQREDDFRSYHDEG